MTPDKLLPFYERELTLLRQSLHEFAERFPKIATQLSVANGVSEDPQVERLIQSFALNVAQLSMKLDDDMPEFTEALLGRVMPYFLRPIPSYAIAEFNVGNEIKAMGATPIPRGTAVTSLASSAGLIECQFRTIYDMTLVPVTITQATYSPVVNAPASVNLPSDATGCISITFSCAGTQQQFASLGLKKLRTYIQGEPAFVAALRDSLFLHTAKTFVEENGNGVWREVMAPEVITEVGYKEDESVIPTEGNAPSVYRLLFEYAAFLEKFNFFDVNFSRSGLYPQQAYQFTLHRVLNAVRADSSLARVLESLTLANLRLGCTPIINLFESSATPVSMSDYTQTYPVTLPARHMASYEVYSIDQVTLTRKGSKEGEENEGSDITVCHPIYSLQHSVGPDSKNIYWKAKQNDEVMMKTLGHETEITLIDSHFTPIEPPQHQVLNMKLTCTNRDLPAQLPLGALEGDLTLDGLASECRIGLLSKPSHSIPVDDARGMQWRLISHLKLNHLSLSQEGLPALKEILSLYNVMHNVMFDRQIQSLTELTHKPTMLWVAEKPYASFQRGIEIQLTVNDGNVAGTSMQGFIRVLDHFFALYTHVNSFTQLIVFSANNGTVICTCKPRPGVMVLI